MAAQFVRLPAGAIGCSVEQMNALSAHMKTSVEQLEQVFRGIDSKINATTWAGPDADGSANNWNSTRQQVMNNLRNFLDCQAAAIRNQANQQTGTSAR